MCIRRPSLDALRRATASALGAVALASMALSPETSQAAEPPAGTGAFAVVVTIKPIHALASAVLGTVAAPELLIDGTGSPHTYALKPSQVRGLHQARAVLIVSDDLETFMGKVASTLPKAVKLVKLDQTPGLIRLPVREGGLFEKDDDHGHGHGHKHGHGTARDKTSWDAHLWLDPENGKAMLAHMAQVFSALAPEHAASFAANARAATTRLDALQQDLIRELQPVAAKPFLVFHDAYQYFERRFGLTSAGSITVNPEVQPGAKRLKALRGRMEAGGVVCVFAEPQFEPKLVATLTEGTKVRKGTLDPIGAKFPSGTDAYESLLRGLASDMKTCLGATS